MIELKKDRYFTAMWFLDGKSSNWMGVIYKDPDDPEGYVLLYRFRYFKDDKVWNSKDERSWTKMATRSSKPDAEQKLVKTVEDMLSLMVKGGYGKTAQTTWDKIELKAVGVEVEEKLIKANKPWMSMGTSDKLTPELKDHLDKYIQNERLKEELKELAKKRAK